MEEVGYGTLVERVVGVLLLERSDLFTNHQLAARLGAPVGVVTHICLLLESKRLISANRPLTGERRTIHVSALSEALRRSV